MFSKVEKEKTHYEKGQIFPFLIAVIVVIIIAAMITVNLGQLSLFKTDVSNAADAAALAGASTLSGTLLGLGLKSDMMCGVMLIEMAVIIWMIISIVLIEALTLAIIVYILLLIKQYITYSMALGDANMGWANAKKTALQYAFQNISIEEPRPTFRQFLREVHNVQDPAKLSLDKLRKYYQQYTDQDDPALAQGSNMRKKIQGFFRKGFSKFMEESAYWDKNRWGKIDPKNTPSSDLVSGYGWNEDGKNSYEDKIPYKQCDNYVEVEVIGNMTYPIEIYSPLGDLMKGADLKSRIMRMLVIPWWLEWLPGNPAEWILSRFFGFLFDFLIPGGLRMGEGTTSDIKEATDDNPIIVTVRRYKRPNNLGLWTFRYGTTEASAESHAYRDVEYYSTDKKQRIIKDIKPALKPGENALSLLFGTLVSLAMADLTFEYLKDKFDTRIHLFDSELTYVR